MIVFNELIYEVVYLYDLRDLGTKDTLQCPAPSPTRGRGWFAYLFVL